MTRASVLLVAAAASLAIASCGATRTRTVTRTASTNVTSAITTAPASVYFQGVVATPAQRPRSLLLTVDGTLFVGAVQWTSWGGPVATGSGNAEYHGCTPSCGGAPRYTALVGIRLSGVRECAGRQYYSGVTLTLNSGRLLDRQYLQRSWSPC